MARMKAYGLFSLVKQALVEMGGKLPLSLWGPVYLRRLIMQEEGGFFAAWGWRTL